MEKIRAVLAEPRSDGRLFMGEIERPSPLPSQTLVQVKAVSLNRGEVRRAMSTDSRYVPGWDLAGVVESTAGDGSGPKAGARVVGLMPVGAWAELVAVPTTNLAELPDRVSFSQAATLPVAGLTALYLLQRGGNLLGRKVLVTGASGGAGSFMVQMARLSGATVIGITHHAGFADSVKDDGAAEVVVGDPAGAGRFGPYHLIADSVGGSTLAAVFSMLAAGGNCINYGTTAGTEVALNIRVFFGAPRASLSGFFVFDEIKGEPASQGLERVVALTADGRLRPRIEIEAPWNQVAEIARRLMDREFSGKAVLLVE